MAEAPKRIGKYPIERRLGKGGMGEVWLAHNPDLDIPVAIKTLSQWLAEEDDSFVGRFVKEAQVAARLNHPNVVRTYDAGSEAEQSYIVMEFVSGGNVRELIETTAGAIEEERALDLVIQVARGLEAAAKLGIIHRDIKPENILLDEEGTPKLADLGLAKRIDGSEGVNLTATGKSMGTPAYISPEQALDSKSADGRADIYSLGATFYHLVTGSLPFRGESALSIIMKHVNEPLEPPCQRNPAVSEGVSRIIVKMMEKPAASRYQTPSELLVDLEEIAASFSSGPPAPGSMRPLLLRRAGAILIDIALVVLFSLGDQRFFWIVLLLYAGISVGWKGRTVGKWLLGLRVVDPEGEKLRWGTSFLRAFGYLVSTLPLGLGFLWALWDSEGETFHDKIARSRMVLARRDAPTTDASGPLP